MKAVLSHVYNYIPALGRISNIQIFKNMYIKNLICVYTDPCMIYYIKHLVLLSGVMYYIHHDCIKHISYANKCWTFKKMNE